MSAAQPPDPVAPDVMAQDHVSADTIAAPRVRRRRLKAEHIRDYGIVAFAIGLFFYFSIASSVFLTKNNLLNLVFQNATIGVAACAVTLTIIAGQLSRGPPVSAAARSHSWKRLLARICRRGRTGWVITGDTRAPTGGRGGRG